ncbi:hypothetical protein ASO20_02050 [Mycoplasma sp. (ex Biomphalaria glabrata)]|uniref:Sapep family Mn(2+)-dependent dipeptidase n=1 Tax=Mycoplasma sp. (ex Biomphalaria glabrata) TaxID=1749074 RepID=UPI00073AD9D8|nr:Sapep family Mn(2+)-dependent dipeptidase [Mycoplasma sp. (ex Biomphalaria glabrata)]ALV23425.1 hypothetical protein ASO20_02050 [Mycoplasma sp. (ex Biomphalaria glabrata)]
MINFKEEIDKRRESILEDLKLIIQTKTVYDEFTISPETPFGRYVAKGFKRLHQLADRDGFIFKDDAGYACHIEYGNGEDLYAALAHIDTVPFDENHWTYHPTSATVIDNEMWGRGTQDDKGPLIACYHALKIIKELKLPIKNKFRLIVGGDEERFSNCIKHYMETHPQPKLAFTPDGNFPVTSAEKYIRVFNLTGKIENNDIIIMMKAGFATNIVPDICEVIVKDINYKMEKYFVEFLTKNNLRGKVEKLQDGVLHLFLKGKSSHACEPEKGVNAIGRMCEFLADFTENEVVQFINFYFNDDIHGHNLGVHYFDSFEGNTTLTLSQLNYENSKFQMAIDTRTPNKEIKEKLPKTLERKLAENFTNSVQVSLIKEGKGLFFDPKSEEVNFFLNIYKNITKDYDAKPLATGGGTYAKNVDNCMCFGAIFEGDPDRAHQIDEKINLDSYFLAIEIYCHTIYKMLNN